MGLLGFSFSLVIGLWVQNPFATVVLRAVAALVIFYILGAVLSVIGQKVILEDFNRQTQARQADGDAVGYGGAEEQADQVGAQGQVEEPGVAV